MIEEFFAAISEAEPCLARSEAKRERLLGYLDVVRPLTALAGNFGVALKEGADLAEAKIRVSWKQAFGELSDLISGLGMRMLVVVDDIDRLQPGELLDLFKVVRLLGRFPGIDFLLAYDEQTVVETLQHSNSTATVDRARAFMEKIVQYPMTLPPLLTSKIASMLEEGIREAVGDDRLTEPADERRLQVMVFETMPLLLRTPRAVLRFLAQVREQFRMHDASEIDDVDLVLITFLRLQAPDLHADLQKWKKDLTRRECPYDMLGHRKSEPDWEPLLGKAADEDRDGIERVMEEMFPATVGKYPSSRPMRRIAHPDYFDRYLLGAIPENDVSDAAIIRALTGASQGIEEELRRLILEADEGVACVALGKITERYPDPGYYGNAYHDLGSPLTQALLAAGMRLWAANPDERGQRRYYLKMWMVRLLRILQKENPETDLLPVLESCESLEPRVEVIATATTETGGLDDATVGSLETLLQRECRRILPTLIEGLRMGDSADTDVATIFLFGLLVENGMQDETKAEVLAGIDRGEFSLEDVAARFVGFSYLMGGSKTKPFGASFSGNLFEQVTGISASSSDLSERGDWDAASWEVRREFAMKHLQRPGAGSSEAMSANR